MRKQIGFAISALGRKHQVILKGFGAYEVTRLIQMVEIIKTRLGMLHQLNKVIVKSVKSSDGESERQITGCQVILSKG